VACICSRVPRPSWAGVNGATFFAWLLPALGAIVAIFCFLRFSSFGCFVKTNNIFSLWSGN
jgi:hypothetical protein